MSTRTKVLVTGADQHQGLAVIRGLGRAGVDVIAAGPDLDSLGFYSRYTARCVRYRPPRSDPDGFIRDVIDGVRVTGAELVMPAVESTMAVLVDRRAQVERYARLAVPPTTAAAYALDKRAMLTLAGSLGVRVPPWSAGSSLEELMAAAHRMTPPFVIKPRGHGSDLAVPSERDFKVRYAANQDELYRVLLPLADHAEKLLVQEYVPGIGRCAAAVWRDGAPVALFAYEREREYPLSGGVSVVRRSIPLDDELEATTMKLLSAIHWHGVAMVEYKFDRRAQSYTLMEINGRFQASTALCIDAGLNLPQLAMQVHLGHRTPAWTPYRFGVVERWLRGDVFALVAAFTASRGRLTRTRRLRAVWHFVRDFARASHYDELSLDDWKPAVVEALSLAGDLGRALLDLLPRFPSPVAQPPDESQPPVIAAVPQPQAGVARTKVGPKVPASVATQRSIRL